MTLPTFSGVTGSILGRFGAIFVSENILFDFPLISVIPFLVKIAKIASPGGPLKMPIKIHCI
jgi:hypothetical protein